MKMDIEIDLQHTADKQPLLQDIFLLNGQLTHLYLYQDNITYENSLQTRCLPYDLDMLFDFQMVNGMVVGFILQYSSILLCFKKQFWVLWKQWQNILLLKIKRKNFHQFFKPIKKIGKGNFASVYLAQRIYDEKLVAIKAFVKQSTYKNGGKAALYNEIKIMRRLNNKHIIRLEGVYETQNSIYFAMQYAEGESLDMYQHNNKQISSQNKKSIMKALLQGIKSMSEQQILHRDIKPQNIVVNSNCTEIKIVDFGLATQINLNEYIYIRCGTPGFVAPEIIKIKDTQSVKLNTISDVFSIGAVFYSLLFNRHLFHAYQHSDVLRLNRTCQIKLTDRQKQTVTPQEFHLLMRMLQVNPDHRITAAQALQQDYFKDKNKWKSPLKQLNRIFTPIDIKSLAMQQRSTQPKKAISRVKVNGNKTKLKNEEN